MAASGGPRAAHGSDIALMPFGAPRRAPRPSRSVRSSRPRRSLGGDAADDSAIWVHPTDPSLSIVIGTDKSTTGGLDVYDLAGNELHVYPDGRMNNVDVRYNFPLAGCPSTSSRRPTASTLRRSSIASSRRPVSGPHRLVPTSSGHRHRARRRAVPLTGERQVLRLRDRHREYRPVRAEGSSGSVTGTLVRQFTRPDATEGLVADDELQRLYVAQEDIGGVYRYGAEPGDGSTNVLVEGTTEVGGAHRPGCQGPLDLLRPGRHRLSHRRQPGRESIPSLRPRDECAGRHLPGRGRQRDRRRTGEDGIDVLGFGLGPTFPDGFFMSQDHVNDGFNQNHKLVSWRTIAQAFTPDLLIDNTWDPRLIGAVERAPETTITAGPDGSVASTTATFQFSASKVGSTVRLLARRSAYTACASPRTYSGLCGLPQLPGPRHRRRRAQRPDPGDTRLDVDISPPAVSSTVPSNGATAVANITTVQATFSEAVAPAQSPARRSHSSGPPTERRSRRAFHSAQANASAILTPGAALAPLTGYTATLAQSIADAAGNQLGQAVSWTFTTASAATRPDTDAVADTDPADRDHPIEPGRSHGRRLSVVNVTATSAVTIPSPTGTPAGDVLVACLALNGSGVASGGAPAGWTAIPVSSTITNPKVAGYYPWQVAANPRATAGPWPLRSSTAAASRATRASIKRPHSTSALQRERRRRQPRPWCPV